MATPTDLPELRVVFAEDGALLRAGILALLGDAPGISVVGVADDLPQLLATIEATDPDVVLTDIRMPPTNSDEGIRAAARLRQTHPQLGVLVLTQYADAAYALELMAGDDGAGAIGGLSADPGTKHGGGRGYLLKERVAAAGELADALRTVAAGGSVIDPVVIGLLMRAGSRQPDSPLARLTPRELEVLAEVAAGASNQRIAERLVVTDRAVEKHVSSIFSKLQLAPTGETHRRVQATLVYLNEVGLGGVGQRV